MLEKVRPLNLYDLEVEKGKDADKGKWPPPSFFTASKAVAGNCVICMKNSMIVRIAFL